MPPQPLSMVNTVEAILDAISVRGQQDALVDAEIARLSGIMGKWTIALVIAIVATVLVAFVLPFMLLVSGPAIVAIVIVLIVYGSQKRTWQKEDLENRRLALIHRFFQVLGQDIPRRQQCAVTASFDDYRRHGRLVAHSNGSLFNPISTFKYEDQWFLARGRLLDGTRFKVSITQTIHRKEKRKRKYTKVNERVSEDVTLLLTLDPAAYPNVARVAGLLQPRPLEQVEIRRAQVQGQTIRLTARTPELQRFIGRGGSTQEHGSAGLASGDLLLWLLSYVYAQLQEARAPETAA